MKKSVLLFIIGSLCWVSSFVFAEAYAGGNLTVTAQQPPGGFVLVSQQSKIITKEDSDPYNIGKMKVTGVVQNQSDPSKREIYSMVVEGYDTNGKCIEVNSNSQVNLAVGREASISVYLALGSKIKSYKAYLVDGEATTGKWDLLTYSSRIVTKDPLDPDAQYNVGNLKIQAVVKSSIGQNEHALYTMIVEGYDVSGKCIEVRNTNHVNTSPGFTGNDTVFLGLGSKIKSFKIYLVDGEAVSGKWDLLTTSSRMVTKDPLDPDAQYNAGNLKIQVVVKSGLEQNQHALYTVLVEGYDVNGKCIEVSSTNHVNTSPGFTGSDALFLSLGSKIKSFKIRLIDGEATRDKITLISANSRILQKDDVKRHGVGNVGKLYVSAVIKNEFTDAKNVSFVVEGYDAKGKMVDRQSSSSYLSSGFSTQLGVHLKSGVTIKKIRYFVVENGKKVEIK